VFSELRLLSTSLKAAAPADEALPDDVVARILGDFKSAISLDGYEQRFKDGEEGPVREFLMLAYLVAESGAHIRETWQRRIIKGNLAIPGIPETVAAALSEAAS
jgi:hypothetical protein